MESHFKDWRTDDAHVAGTAENQLALLEYLTTECLYQNTGYRNNINKLVDMIARYHTNKEVFIAKYVFRIKYICCTRNDTNHSLIDSFDSFLRPLFELYNSGRFLFVIFSSVASNLSDKNKISFLLNGRGPIRLYWIKHIAGFLDQPGSPYKPCLKKDFRDLSDAWRKKIYNAWNKGI